MANMWVLPQSSLARILSESYTTPLRSVSSRNGYQAEVSTNGGSYFDPVRTHPDEMWKNSKYSCSYDKILVGLSLLSGNTEHGFQLAQQCADEKIDVIGGS